MIAEAKKGLKEEAEKAVPYSAFSGRRASGWCLGAQHLLDGPSLVVSTPIAVSNKQARPSLLHYGKMKTLLQNGNISVFPIGINHSASHTAWAGIRLGTRG